MTDLSLEVGKGRQSRRVSGAHQLSWLVERTTVNREVASSTLAERVPWMIADGQNVVEDDWGT